MDGCHELTVTVERDIGNARVFLLQRISLVSGLPGPETDREFGGLADNFSAALCMHIV